MKLDYRTIDFDDLYEAKAALCIILKEQPQAEDDIVSRLRLTTDRREKIFQEANSLDDIFTIKDPHYRELKELYRIAGYSLVDRLIIAKDRELEDFINDYVEDGDFFNKLELYRKIKGIPYSVIAKRLGISPPYARMLFYNSAEKQYGFSTAYIHAFFGQNNDRARNTNLLLPCNVVIESIQQYDLGKLDISFSCNIPSKLAKTLQYSEEYEKLTQKYRRLTENKEKFIKRFEK